MPKDNMVPIILCNTIYFVSSTKNFGYCLFRIFWRLQNWVSRKRWFVWDKFWGYLMGHFRSLGQFFWKIFYCKEVSCTAECYLILVDWDLCFYVLGNEHNWEGATFGEEALTWSISKKCNRPINRLIARNTWNLWGALVVLNFFGEI